jgi:DNA-binding transcriptional regulator PaaX
MNTKNNKSFTKELLEYINDVGVLIPGIESPYEYTRRIRRATYYGTLRRLEKQNFVKKIKANKRTEYRITKKGEQVLAESFKIKKRKDGSSTIVVFDIPEEKRIGRNALRRYLYKHGFKVLQKSVYISTNIVPKNIVDVVKELELNSYVSIIGGKIEYFL